VTRCNAEGRAKEGALEKLHCAASAADEVVQSVGFGMVAPPSPMPRPTDAEALQGDWIKVGQDISRDMENVRRRAGR
jgi:hypothetical protein